MDNTENIKKLAEWANISTGISIIWVDEEGNQEPDDISKYFNPYENIADAWMLVDKIIDEHTGFKISKFSNDWFVVIYFKNMRLERYGDTPQQAICEAVLEYIDGN
jgi:hypothetical protein